MYSYTTSLLTAPVLLLSILGSSNAIPLERRQYKTTAISDEFGITTTSGDFSSYPTITSDNFGVTATGGFTSIPTVATDDFSDAWSTDDSSYPTVISDDFGSATTSAGFSSPTVISDNFGITGTSISESYPTGTSSENSSFTSSISDDCVETTTDFESIPTDSAVSHNFDTTATATGGFSFLGTNDYSYPTATADLPYLTATDSPLSTDIGAEISSYLVDASYLPTGVPIPTGGIYDSALSYLSDYFGGSTPTQYPAAPYGSYPADASYDASYAYESGYPIETGYPTVPPVQPKPEKTPCTTASDGWYALPTWTTVRRPDASTEEVAVTSFPAYKEKSKMGLFW
ncbi:MAG: hypothetical protein MMC23_001437 [Stictis urceolatum]|nr:hypothetical protein [Stictis urceolata]